MMKHYVNVLDSIPFVNISVLPTVSSLGGTYFRVGKNHNFLEKVNQKNQNIGFFWFKSDFFI